MTARYFEDLEIWKMARELSKEIYSATRNTRFSKDYGLVNQIRRASISIMSNIAEGFERQGNREFIQHLSVSKASCGELRSQLYVALDQEYIDLVQFESMTEHAKKLSIMISHFIDYLRRSGFRGTKYRQLQKSPATERTQGVSDKKVKYPAPHSKRRRP
jgi:four helix bundle protein